MNEGELFPHARSAVRCPHECMQQRPVVTLADHEAESVRIDASRGALETRPFLTLSASPPKPPVFPLVSLRTCLTGVNFVTGRGMDVRERRRRRHWRRRQRPLGHQEPRSRRVLGVSPRLRRAAATATVFDLVLPLGRRRARSTPQQPVGRALGRRPEQRGRHHGTRRRRGRFASIGGGGGGGRFALRGRRRTGPLHQRRQRQRSPARISVVSLRRRGRRWRASQEPGHRGQRG